MNSSEIKEILRMSFLHNYNVFVPEFTFGDYRIDGAVFNTKTRWIRGFEIKVSRSDFITDEKWPLYSTFLSSLTIVCPNGLIRKEEVAAPFGLLWIDPNKDAYSKLSWIKRPKKFQKRDCFAWFNTYTRALELEFNRMAHEMTMLRRLS